MPTGLVKTRQDEILRESAKAKAKRQSPDDFYALAVYIFKKMKGGGGNAKK